MSDLVAPASSGLRAAPIWRTAAALGGLALLLVLVWGRVLGFEIRRDETMFVPPAAFLGDLALYRDVFYNHVPYSAWLFRAAERAFGEYGLLLSARLVICAAWLVLVAAVGLTVLRLSRSGGLAVLSAMSLLMGEALLNQTGMTATNNLLPLAFMAAGLGLFLVTVIEGRPRAAMLVLAGVCLSVAAGLKISAGAVIPAVAIGAFLVPAGMPFARRVTHVALPLALGGLIGGAPALAVLAADPSRVLAHVVGFHTGPHVAWWAENIVREPGVALGLGGKAQIAYDLWLGGTSLLLGVVLVFLLLVARRDPAGGIRATTEMRAALIAAAAILSLVVMAFVPSPGFPQYYAPPLALLPFLPALAMRRLGPEGREQAAPVLLAAGLAMLALGAPRLLPAAAVWADPGASTPARSAEVGAILRARLEAEGLAEGRVATLMPIYPLEGGLAVYPEFATGPFAYRIAQVTEPELAARYVMAGPGDLHALFAAEPPAAILTGFVPDIEGPFLSWAEAQGYRAAPPLGIADRYGTLKLHLAPRGVAAAPTDETDGTGP